MKLFHGGVINSATIGKPADPKNQEGGVVKSVDAKGVPDVIEFRVPVNDYAKRIEANIRPAHFKKNAEMRVLYSPKDYIPQVKAEFDASSNKGSMVPRGCSKAGLLGCVTTTAVFKNTEKYCCSSPTISADVAKDTQKCTPGRIRLSSKEKLKSIEDGKIYTCEKGTYWDYYLSSLVPSSSSGVVEGEAVTTTTTTTREESQLNEEALNEGEALAEEQERQRDGGDE